MLYAIGGNPEVARLAGINVRRATVLVYVVCSFLAGLAGMVLAARLNSVQPSIGVSYELDTIAAVVIGGTSLSGGTGGIGGTIIGVLIIGVLRNGLNLLSVSPFLQQVIIGAVIVLAVAGRDLPQVTDDAETSPAAAARRVRENGRQYAGPATGEAPQGGTRRATGGTTMRLSQTCSMAATAAARR